MAEEAAVKPDAGTFDLGEWVSGNHTYPRYGTTIHLNGEAVVAANKALEQVKELEQEELHLMQQTEKSPSTGSLGAPNSMAEKLSKVSASLRDKRKEYKDQLDKAKASALKVQFRSKGGNTYRTVRDRLRELMPDISDMTQTALTEALTENPELAQRQQALLFLELVDEITNPKGQNVDISTLSVETVEGLLERAATPDLNRLTMAMNQTMIGADLREEEIDAGFPG